MKCDKCGGRNKGHYYLQDNHEWWCIDCYPMGKLAGWSPLEKLKSRSLMPDGSVVTGRDGQRIRDVRRKAQQMT